MQPPIPNGTVLQNRYRSIQVLGQGGFGRTYLAEDQGRFNERCAFVVFGCIKQARHPFLVDIDTTSEEGGPCANGKVAGRYRVVNAPCWTRRAMRARA